MVLRKSRWTIKLWNSVDNLSLLEQDVNQLLFIYYTSGTESAGTAHQEKLLRVNSDYC